MFDAILVQAIVRTFSILKSLLFQVFYQHVYGKLFNHRHEWKFQEQLLHQCFRCEIWGMGQSDHRYTSIEIPGRSWAFFRWRSGCLVGSFWRLTRFLITAAVLELWNYLRPIKPQPMPNIFVQQRWKWVGFFDIYPIGTSPPFFAFCISAAPVPYIWKSQHSARSEPKRYFFSKHQMLRFQSQQKTISIKSNKCWSKVFIMSSKSSKYMKIWWRNWIGMTFPISHSRVWSAVLPVDASSSAICPM